MVSPSGWRTCTRLPQGGRPGRVLGQSGSVVPQNRGMTKPAAKAQILVTDDGVPIEAVHVDGDRRLAFVVAHGFTLHWRWPHVWRVASRLGRHGGVAVFDFRGHGRSGGHSTLGDLEIKDLDVVVRYLRELGYEQVVTVGFSMGGSIVLRHAGLVGGVDGVISV